MFNGVTEYLSTVSVGIQKHLETSSFVYNCVVCYSVLTERLIQQHDTSSYCLMCCIHSTKRNPKSKFLVDLWPFEFQELVSNVVRLKLLTAAENMLMCVKVWVLLRLSHINLWNCNFYVLKHWQVCVTLLPKQHCHIGVSQARLKYSITAQTLLIKAGCLYKVVP